MLIVCPNCATSYDVDVASLRPDGRRVRCVRCRTIWHAELPHEERLIAAAEALAPVRRAVEAVAEVAAADGGNRGHPRSNSMPPRAPKPTVGGADVRSVRRSAAVRYARRRGISAVAEDSSVEVESPPIAPGEAEAISRLSTSRRTLTSRQAPNRSKILRPLPPAAIPGRASAGVCNGRYRDCSRASWR